MNARRIATQGAIVALPSERDGRGGALGKRKPPLGLSRPPGQRANPGPEDRKRGVLHQLVVIEPAKPLLHGRHAPVVIQRQGQPVDQAGQGGGLAGGMAVTDRLLGQIVGHAPGHRAAVELRDCFGVATLELVSQQLAEQVVVAVPLAPTVEWHHEAVGTLERLEDGRGPPGLKHGVTQPAAHPSSTEVCMRNRASASGRRDNSSKRK